MLSSLRALSWQVTAVLGLALLAIALQLAVTGDRIDAERASARAAGQPEPVALSAFDPLRDVHAAGEVHLVVRIDPAAVIAVSQQGRGGDGAEATMTRRLYPLQDPSDDAGAAVVRGAVLLSDQEVGDFLALVARTGEGVPGRGPRPCPERAARRCAAACRPGACRAAPAWPRPGTVLCLCHAVPRRARRGDGGPVWVLGCDGRSCHGAWRRPARAGDRQMHPPPASAPCRPSCPPACRWTGFLTQPGEGGGLRGAVACVGPDRRPAPPLR